MVRPGRVVLAMSGGVDSSVAAHLLLEAGHEVIGVFMRHGEESAASCRLEDGSPNPLLPILQGREDHKQGCCSASDAADARRVAERLGIPFFAVDLQGDFKRIVDYFVDQYRSGRTPNPCVQCNNWIKFGRLFDYVEAVQADYLATGHYARLVPTGSSTDPVAVRRGLDSSKDQSYVLAGIDRRVLPRLLLPVGEYLKSDIRARAADVGLRVATKKDSQEICFVTSGKHADFVRQRSSGSTAGALVTSAGRVVGEHSGIEQFTIGQRKGIGIAMREPQYVVAIDPESYRVTIGGREELACGWLEAEQVNWMVAEPPAVGTQLECQFRYNSAPQPARLERVAANRFRVSLEGSPEGVAPGQLAALYQGTQLLGGGWIERTGRG
jgi:tRNA-uridine 2-sulfurtransferase